MTSNHYQTHNQTHSQNQNHISLKGIPGAMESHAGQEQCQEQRRREWRRGWQRGLGRGKIGQRETGGTQGWVARARWKGRREGVVGQGQGLGLDGRYSGVVGLRSHVERERERGREMKTRCPNSEGAREGGR
ncbi:hypothetical protein CIPAW_08G181200 [Carya illinoinensis]|uniref:Uncharacterized protein n=1 Tax=Carya illinoinensis TaxID=32201 RepID=A0A8T1PXW3_CARIL|nr:hypothetical protein CIPAW_08G181200 [Carya illinoinensis]